MAVVSVIIPVYNGASSLPKALESVLAQTYTPIEVIVVDDGSTDGVAEVLAPYRDRINFIQQQNAGASAARNTGIRASHGEFLGFLDADDIWAANKLELQMPRFSDPTVGLVYSDFTTRFEDGSVRESYLDECPLACEGDVLEHYVQSRFLLPSTVVVRRQCVDEFGGFDETFAISEDVDLFARIFTRWHAAQVRLPLAIRHEGRHNLTRNQKRTTDDTILALEKVRKVPGLAAPVQRALHGELGRQYWYQGYSSYTRGEMAEARRSLLMSMRHDRAMWKTCLPVLLSTLLPAGLRERLKRMRHPGALRGDRGVLQS